MSEVAISGETVRFTRNDVGPAVGDGRLFTEQKNAEIMALLADNRVVTGGVLPTSANLTTTVSACIAFIKGYYVDAPATNVTVGAGVVTYVILSLKVDGDGNVTEAIYELNTTGVATYPKNIVLGRLTSSGAAITSTEDLAPRGQSGFIEPVIWSAFIAAGG